MGKVVAKAAIIVGGAALIATGVGAAAGAGIIASSAFTAAAATWGTIGGVAAGLLSATAAATAKKPKSLIGDALSGGFTSRVSIDPRQPQWIVVGRTALPTQLIYFGTEGANNELLSQIFVHAPHEIDGYETLTIDGVETTVNADGSVQGAYAGILTIERTRGDHAAQPFANVAGGQWTADHKGLGLAMSHFRWTYDKEKLVSGLPQNIMWVGRGIRVYDHRRDSTAGGVGAMRANDRATWAWSVNSDEIGRNPALVECSYRLGWTKGPRLWAGMGEQKGNLLPADYMAAANICSEEIDGGPRYRIDGILSLADTHNDNLSRIHASCAGRPIDVGGLVGFWVAHDDTASPIMTLDIEGGDLVGDLSWAAMPEGVRNTGRGTFRDPTNAYSQQAYREVAPQDLRALDNVVELTDTLSFDMIQDADQARRVTSIRLRESRQGVLAGPFRAKALGLRPLSVVAVNRSRAGWVGRRFRVERMDFALDKIGLQLSAIASNDYADVDAVPTVVPGEVPTLGYMGIPGVLAFEDFADWQTQVQGAGKPDDFAVNTRLPDAPFGPNGATFASAEATIIGLTNDLAAIEQAIEDTDLGDTGAVYAAKQAAEQAAQDALARSQVAQNYSESASASAVTATGKAQIATEQAAAAATNSSLAVRFSAGALNRNAEYADWPTNTDFTYPLRPTGWAQWQGYDDIDHRQRVIGLNGRPYAFREYCPATQSQGTLQNLDARAGWYVIDAQIVLASGTLQGAGVYLEGFQGGSVVTSAALSFAAEPSNGATGPTGPGVTGGLYAFTKLVQLPQPFTILSLYQMTGWAGLVGGNAGQVAEKILHWHRCSVRPASAAEIEARAAGTALESKASITQLAQLGADQDAARADLRQIVDASFAGTRPTALQDAIDQRATIGAVDGLIAGEAAARQALQVEVQSKASTEQLNTAIAGQNGARAALSQSVDARFTATYQVLGDKADITAVDGLIAGEAAARQALVPVINAKANAQTVQDAFASEAAARGQLKQQVDAQLAGTAGSGLKMLVDAKANGVDVLQALVGRDAAIAQVRTDLTASYNGLAAEFTEQAGVIAGIDGKVAFYWQVVGTTPDGKTKLQLTSDAGGSFIVDAAQAIFTGDLIVQGTIKTGALAPNAVTSSVAASDATGYGLGSEGAQDGLSVTSGVTGGTVRVDASVDASVSSLTFSGRYQVIRVKDGVETPVGRQIIVVNTSAGPPYNLFVLDTPGAGVVTYKLRFTHSAGAGSLAYSNQQVVMTELKR